MPIESTYPSLQIPDVDLWAFLFERKDKNFADDKGMSLHDLTRCLTRISDRPTDDTTQ